MKTKFIKQLRNLKYFYFCLLTIAFNLAVNFAYGRAGGGGGSHSSSSPSSGYHSSSNYTNHSTGTSSGIDTSVIIIIVVIIVGFAIFKIVQANRKKQ